jgi:methionyl-tRNA formyltransferase
VVAATRSLRVVFLGNDERSLPSLQALARSRHEVALVATRIPRPGRRGAGPIPTPVARAATALGLPLAEVPTVREGAGLETLSTAAPEVLAVVAYGEILPAQVLRFPTIAPVNLHFSLLPLLRGASPVQAALLQGLDVTGVTTIVMDEGLDTGPILRQREEAIRADDDAGSLGDRLAGIGAEVLVGTIDELSAGRVTPVPQDESRATYAPKLGPADRVLDWSQPAIALANQVRGLAPDPAATTTFRRQALKVFRAAVTNGGGDSGVIVETTDDGFVVAAGEGALLVLEVGPPGVRRMRAADFVRGHRPAPGERLG